MSDSQFKNDLDRESTSDADLTKRLRKLDDRIAQTKAEHSDRHDNERQRTSLANRSALAYGFHLSSEFIASVLGGGVVGWSLDYFLPTSPWGLIAFVLIGFAVGLVNIVKSTKARHPDH
ncbi:AtpZ/AtpI family protein [Bradyrhizobium pachyrhizi]|nr:AtpZ/AtpI family protein [Bradyrhizobium pachyrhizi]